VRTLCFKEEGGGNLECLFMKKRRKAGRREKKDSLPAPVAAGIKRHLYPRRAGEGEKGRGETSHFTSEGGEGRNSRRSSLKGREQTKEGGRENLPASPTDRRGGGRGGSLLLRGRGRGKFNLRQRRGWWQSHDLRGLKKKKRGEGRGTHFLDSHAEKILRF